MLLRLQLLAVSLAFLFLLSPAANAQALPAFQAPSGSSGTLYLPPPPPGSSRGLPPRLQLPPAVPSDKPTSKAKTPADLTMSYSHGERLSEITRQVLNDVFAVPFILSTELLALPDEVALGGILNMSKPRALAMLTYVLKTRGFTLTLGEVYTVEKTPEALAGAGAPPKIDVEPREYIVYRPKHRTAQVFYKQLPGLFPRVYFSFSKRQNSPFSPDTEKSQSSSIEVPDEEKDEPLDSFFSYVPVSQLEDLKRVLASIDIPYQQVTLRAALYEVSTTKEEGAGASFTGSLLGQHLGVSIGSNVSTQGVTLSAGGFSAMLSLLDTNAHFNSLDQPSTLALSGKRSTLSLGQRIPTLGATTKDAAGATTRQVTYQEVGTILKVKPVVRDETVLLDVSLEISSAHKTDTGVDDSPTITQHTLSTFASMPSGSFIILGGSRSSQDSKAANSFFGVRTSHKDSSSRTEVVLLLYVEKTDATPSN